MQHLAAWLESGGFVMYLLLFGLAPLVAICGLLHLILASRNSFLQLCLCLALVLGVGILATGLQRSRVANLLAMARPDERLHLAIAGYREANRPFELSLAIGLAGLLPCTLGEIRRGRKHAAREGQRPGSTGESL
jgi:integral membrane sensor domain MASE1